MNLGIHPFRAALAVAAAGCLIAGVAQPATAAPPDSVPSGVPQLEALDRRPRRGRRPARACSSAGACSPPRSPAPPTTGLTGPDFAVYRDGERARHRHRLHQLRRPRRHRDRPVPVAPVVNGIELDGRRGLAVGAGLARPPAAEARRRRHAAASPRGVHVLGQRHVGRRRRRRRPYEYIVKWDPSNSKDVCQRGWTGPSTSTPTSTTAPCCNRLDLGVNIRAGAHYTQFLVYDFDGDGKAETHAEDRARHEAITLQRRRHGRQRAVHHACPRRTSTAGYAHTDDYRLSAADYRPPRRACSRAGAAPRGRRGPLAGDARGGAGHRAVSTTTRSRTRTRRRSRTTSSTSTRPAAAPATAARFEGFIVDGPEYLTVFDGATGKELQTIDYKPGRGDDGLLWGDYAMARIEPGNRVDRFLAGVAYLDGQHAVGGLRPRLLHAHDDRRVRLGRQDAQGALVRRQRPRADDQPVQRRPARPRRHRPRLRRRSRRRASTRCPRPTSTATASRRSSTARRRSTTTAASSTLVRRAAPRQRRPGPRSCASATATPCT